MQMYYTAFKNEINSSILFRKILNKGKKGDHFLKVVSLKFIIY